MEKKDYSNHGVCPKDCDKCCSSVLPLSDYEINKIKKYIRRNNIQPNNPNADLNNPKFVDICPFRTSNGCSIYVNRPSVCKWFNCFGNKGKFDHSDKHLVNMLLEFYPDEVCASQPNIEFLDLQYQESKHRAKM